MSRLDERPDELPDDFSLLLEKAFLGDKRCLGIADSTLRKIGQLSKSQPSCRKQIGNRHDSGLHQAVGHGGHDVCGAADLNQDHILAGLKALAFEKMASSEVYRAAKSGDGELLAAKLRRFLYRRYRGIDACKPYDWIRDFPKVVQSSLEEKQQVIDKWPEIFK